MLIFLHKIFPHGILKSGRALFFLAFLILVFLSEVYSVEYLVFHFIGIRLPFVALSLISASQLIALLVFIWVCLDPILKLYNIIEKEPFYRTKFLSSNIYECLCLLHEKLEKELHFQILKIRTQNITSKEFGALNTNSLLSQSGILMRKDSILYNKTG
jgi:hypothetical protein